jgi:hypothetical protein
MRPLHWPARSAMGTRERTRCRVLLIAILSLISGGGTFAQEPIAAVWKVRELDFFYRNSAVPCHEVPIRVANMLRAIGARDDVQVRVTGCDDSVLPHDRDMDMGMDTERDRWSTFENPSDRFGTSRDEPRQAAHVRVRLMIPVAVTPEVLAEIDRDKSRRELISRVTGNPAAAMNEPIVFGAQRQTVTLSRQSVRLEPEDCQLLDEMTKNVFRQLDVHVVRRNFTCNSRELSRITPQLTVEALMPTGVLMPMPAQEQSQPKVSTPTDTATEQPQTQTEPPPK